MAVDPTRAGVVALGTGDTPVIFTELVTETVVVALAGVEAVDAAATEAGAVLAAVGAGAALGAAALYAELSSTISTTVSVVFAARIVRTTRAAGRGRHRERDDHGAKQSVR